jgi:hypothetical protein
MKEISAVTIMAMLIIAGQSKLFPQPTSNGPSTFARINPTSQAAAPSATIPSVTSMNPINGQGQYITFRVVYTDPAGNADLTNAYLLFDSGLKDGTEQCWIIYLPPSNTMYLMNENGTVAGVVTPGKGGTVSNGLCNITNPRVMPAGNTLTISVDVGFSSTFRGTKNVYGLAAGLNGKMSGYQLLGTWTPNPLMDWPQFGWDVASSGAPSLDTRISAGNLSSLIRHQVNLSGVVDAAPIYLQQVYVNRTIHDVFFVTTTYGKTIALDADGGSVLWEFTPPTYSDLVKTQHTITTSTPAADPDRRHIYAAAPDGNVRKLAIADGSVVWTTPITLSPTYEKIASPLKLFQGRVVAVTGGYVGDVPPYIGHVAVLDAQSGGRLHIWNSLCSDHTDLMNPGLCPSAHLPIFPPGGSAIWGRAGAVIDAATGNIYVATGNGNYDGVKDWGDSVVELDPNATQVLGYYTPKNNALLELADLDLGSTSPVLLGAGLLAQGGKDGVIRLLGSSTISDPKLHVGNELQTVSTPSSGKLITAPVVWHDSGETWMFATDYGATAAWKLSNGQLSQKWSDPATPNSSIAAGGTSPVIAGGLLYVYNPSVSTDPNNRKGGLKIYDPRSGKLITTLDCGAGHWNSPIVADGRIALTEVTNSTTGVLNIWTLR